MSGVTVVLCTRDRPAQVVNAVRTLLDTSADDLELLLIDQSDQNATELALNRFADDTRFRYRRTATRGKGAGLNEGLQIAQHDIIVFTDDDCLVPKDWAIDMSDRLGRHPEAAILFCNLVPVPHDTTRGYVPTYERSTARVVTGLAQLRDGLGLGAAMAVRRQVALDLKGFDETFGPGARFPSADEWDLCVRALLRGYHILETPELSVVHDGFRSAAAGKEHAARDWKALGAICTKLLRAGGPRAAAGPAMFFGRKALVQPLAALVQRRRPQGLARIVAFLSGFREGMKTPMDPETLHFR